MAAHKHRQFGPRDIARALFRYKRRMQLVFCSVLLLTLVAIAFYPRSYTSESKLFIRVGRESVALDPTATTGQTIMMQKTQVDEVNSALQVLLSREVLQKAALRVGADRIVQDAKAISELGNNADSPNDWTTPILSAKSWVQSKLGNALTNLHLADPGTTDELAVRKLESGVKAYAPRDSTVITISFSAASPQLSHDVVEAVTNVFLEEHLRINHSEGSLAFFSEQASSLQKELSTAQEALRDRKNEFGIASIESRRMVFSEQLKDVELQVLSAERELYSSDAEIADLTGAINSLQPELITNRVNGFANEGKDLMREKLYELEIEESKLRSRYSDGHPLLEQIQTQRKQAEEILKGMPNDRTQTTAALNPNQKQLELDLLQTKAKKEAQQGRLTAAQKQQSELKKQLKELNEAEVQLGDLERNVQLLDGKYRMHVDKLEQARVNDALGRDGISNVKVAQAATLVTKPSAPKKPLLLMLGIVVALSGALAVPIVAELFDERLNTAEQVEIELGLPVLMALPFKDRAQGSLVKTGGGANDCVAGDYRTLVNQLLPASSDASSKAVGVVGCDISPLRSDVAAELAMQAANCGNARVLLIDADERHRNVAERFGLNGSPGWHEVLAGAADPQSCVHSADNGRLAVMTSGRSTARSEVAGLTSSSTQLGELKQMYGLVVVDVPSVAVFNTRASADWLDESLLVIEAGRTRTETARRARILIERSGIRVAGVVLASQREYIPRWLNERL
jgi:uncharacterized protein involved in exopolysaccharide biosynthesis